MSTWRDAGNIAGGHPRSAAPIRLVNEDAAAPAPPTPTQFQSVSSVATAAAGSGNAALSSMSVAGIQWDNGIAVVQISCIVRFDALAIGSVTWVSKIPASVVVCPPRATVAIDPASSGLVPVDVTITAGGDITVAGTPISGAGSFQFDITLPVAFA